MKIHGIKYNLPNGTPYTAQFFKRNNDVASAALVYGENGAGKSTIANAFRIIEGGDQPFPELLVSPGSDDTLRAAKKINIYDEDFIDRNVKISADGLDAIVMLGGQVAAQEKIDKKRDELKELNEDKRKLEERLELLRSGRNGSIKHAQSNVSEVLRAKDGWVTRKIEIQGNNKNISVTDRVLKQIIAASGDNNGDVQSVHRELDALRNRISTLEVGKPLSDLDCNIPDATRIDEFSRLLDRRFSLPGDDPIIERLASVLNLYGPARVREIKNSVDEQFDSCPHCLQDVSSEHRGRIAHAIEAVYDETISNFESMLQEYNWPEVAYPTPDYVSIIDSPVISNLDEACENYRAARDLISKTIDEKLTRLDESLQVDIDGFKEVLEQLSNAVSKFNREIDKYNSDIERVAALREKCIRLNDRAGAVEAGSELKVLQDLWVERDEALAEVERLVREEEEAEKDIRQLQAEQRNLKVALELINSYVAYVFFSSSRLKLENHGESYRILVNGSPVRPNRLSTGERNILALAYYFARARESNSLSEKIEDTVFVLDDPVSSLDDSNRFGVLSFLRSIFSQLLESRDNQILILTHSGIVAQDINAIFTDINGVNRNFFELSGNGLDSVNIAHYDRYDRCFDKLLNSFWEIRVENNSYDDIDPVAGNELRQLVEAFMEFEYGKKVTEFFDPILKSSLSLCNPTGDSGETLSRLNYFNDRLFRLHWHGSSHLEMLTRSGSLRRYDDLSRSEKYMIAEDTLALLYWLNPLHVVGIVGRYFEHHATGASFERLATAAGISGSMSGASPVASDFVNCATSLLDNLLVEVDSRSVLT